MKASDILKAANAHMQDRAATYDKPQGERSMEATVTAFLAITGIDLTTEQGWLFMVLLKAVRSQQGNFKLDNYEDLAAYAGLMGEQAYIDRAPKIEEYDVVSGYSMVTIKDAFEDEDLYKDYSRMSHGE